MENTQSFETEMEHFKEYTKELNLFLNDEIRDKYSEAEIKQTVYEYLTLENKDLEPRYSEQEMKEFNDRLKVPRNFSPLERKTYFDFVKKKLNYKNNGKK